VAGGDLFHGEQHDRIHAGAIWTLESQLMLVYSERKRSIRDFAASAFPP
jgi:hypothetical protein